ncbi:MAG TPA: molecular chaperone [Candidatus Rokubacteria bacterium]|nr:molecular chaperone [Candidatus Rokubacteria bacterium]
MHGGRSMRIECWHPLGGVERWDPFRGEMNRLFDSFFRRPTVVETAPGACAWMPVVDMYETKDDVVLTFEVPGVREKDIALSITGDMLTVRGARAFDRELEKESYHRVERAYGQFERTLELPMPVQADRVKATYRDGVLEVKLPKAEEVKPKAIKIDIL